MPFYTSASMRKLNGYYAYLHMSAFSGTSYGVTGQRVYRGEFPLVFHASRVKLHRMRRRKMSVQTQKTDAKGRLTLPHDFAGCLVTVERRGDELRVRKVRQGVARRYSFKQLMAGVTKKNIHAEISSGPAVGGEVL
jgi:hypothetical protein